MKNAYRIGWLLVLLWAAWSIYAFATFKELAILLALYGCIGGAIVLVIYFALVWLLNGSRPMRRLGKILLLLLAVAVLAGIGRWLWLGYDYQYRGRNLDFSQAQPLPLGVPEQMRIADVRKEEPDQEMISFTPAHSGYLQVEFAFDTNEEATLTYITLYDPKGQSIGSVEMQQDGTKMILHSEVKQGETYHIVIENVRIDGDVTFRLNARLLAE